MPMKFHPVVHLFPRLDNETRANLKTSIRKYGCTHPVLVWEGQIIDGRHRVEICDELKAPFKTEVFHGTQEEAIQHAWDLNDKRRHYESKEQKAMTGAKLAKILEEAARDRQKQGVTLGSIGTQGRSAEHAAKKTGVSVSQIKRAKSVLDHGTPELVEAVNKGDVTVRDAAAVANVPDDVQRAAVKAVKEGNAKTARAAVEANGKGHLNGHANGKPADPERKPVDGWGIPIQDHAQVAFDAQGKFDELLSLLRKADRLYSEIADHEGGAYLRRPGISINARDRWKHKGIQNAILNVTDCRPTYTVCPYAFAKDAKGKDAKHGKDCPLCHGLNWVRPLGKNEVPDELIAKAKEAGLV